MPETITNQNAELKPGSMYVLEFSYPGWVPRDVVRQMSDSVNVRATWANKYLNFSDYELLGTTVQPSKNRFFAVAKVRGTPLLVIVAPIVQIILIVTAGVVLLTFIKATLADIAPKVGSAVEAAGEALKDIAEGAKEIGKGAGTGLKFGLPVLGIGIAIIVGLSAFAAGKVR